MGLVCFWGDFACSSFFIIFVPFLNLIITTYIILVMKKFLFVLIAAFTCSSMFAQRTVVGQGKGVCTDPAVSITIVSATETEITAHFEPNAECHHYSYVIMTDDDVAMFTAMFGVTLEALVEAWGISTTGVETYTWDDMVPNTTYKVFALPYSDASTYTVASFAEVTTEVLGDDGVSVIDIAVSQIDTTHAVVVCTPNEHTALFYDGLVTVEFFNEIGVDSACTILRENTVTPSYTAYSWFWPDLMPNTAYYAIAFGQNAAEEWGDTTICQFSTLPVGVESHDVSEVSVFPVPNNGHFAICGENLQGGKAQIYALNGQLMEVVALDSDHNAISTNLSAGSYLLVVVNAEGRNVQRKTIVVR